jgi:hypothetical protein
LDIAAAAEALSPPERGRLSLTLLDLDPAALANAGQRLSKFVTPAQLTCERVNLFRLPEHEAANKLFDESCLIVCTGLFDYLNDTSATAMLRLFWQSLATNGRMLVFNFTPENSSRAYMEWIGNWYVVHRARRELARLAADAGIPDDCFTIRAEPLGVNAFIDANPRLTRSQRRGG